MYIGLISRSSRRSSACLVYAVMSVKGERTFDRVIFIFKHKNKNSCYSFYCIRARMERFVRISQVRHVARAQWCYSGAASSHNVSDALLQPILEAVKSDKQTTEMRAFTETDWMIDTGHRGPYAQCHTLTSGIGPQLPKTTRTYGVIVNERAGLALYNNYCTEDSKQ